MLVNTWQHARHEPATGIDWTIDTLLQSRFYPIFSLLFGISFVLFLQGADRVGAAAAAVLADWSSG